MKRLSCISFILLCYIALSCAAVSVDLSKETAHAQKITELNHKIKRSADELDNLLNEIASDDEYLNVPIHVIDKEKLQSSPLLQYLLLHKPFRAVQEKRALDYKPRMGRRSDDNELPKPYDVLFTPRMGKRAELLTNFTPRMGRSAYSE